MRVKFDTDVAVDAIVNAGGTITLGGTAQTPLGAGKRAYLLIHNPSSETETLWVFLGAAAVAGAAVGLAPGGTWELDGSAVPESLVSVLAATTGHKFVLLYVPARP